jgi:4-oxalocrotonate tautomerase
MPHISIKMYPGRDEKTKKALAEKTQAFFVETMGMEGKYFSVSVEEIEKENWQEEVVEAIDEKELYIKANF